MWLISEPRGGLGLVFENLKHPRHSLTWYELEYAVEGEPFTLRVLHTGQVCGGGGGGGRGGGVM